MRSNRCLLACVIFPFVFAANSIYEAEVVNIFKTNTFSHMRCLRGSSCQSLKEQENIEELKAQLQKRCIICKPKNCSKVLDENSNDFQGPYTAWMNGSSKRKYECHKTFKGIDSILNELPPCDSSS